MYPMSAAALAALRTSQNVDYRTTAYSPYAVVGVELAIDGGSVQYDAKSQTRRSATLQCADPTQYDLVTPWGAEVGIEYGIRTPSGWEWVPLIRGVVTDQSDVRPADSGQSFQLAISDRSVMVMQDRYISPTSTNVGATAVSEINRLITESLPTVTVDTSAATSTDVLAQITIERERWTDGVEKISDTIAHETFADRLGNFVIRPQPVLEADPVWTVDEGSRGVLVQAQRDRTRDSAYNALVIIGERTDSTAPVYLVVYDTDPDSPTFYGGPYGRKPFFYQSATITSTDQATLVGNALLQRVRGVATSINFTSVTNPGLDPGDVILSVVDGVVQRHIIDTVTIPLDPTQGMTLQTRTNNLPEQAG